MDKDFLRKYDVQSLPMTDAAGMVVLLIMVGGRLVQLVESKPEGVSKGELDRLRALAVEMDAERVQLQAALAGNNGGNENSPDRQVANAAVDAAWKFVKVVASGWVENPRQPAKQKAAAAILEALFPDDLAVLRLPHRKKWSNLGTRLTLIEDRKLMPAFRILGLAEAVAPMIDSVQQFGDALGITSPQQVQETKVELVMRDCKELLREVQRATLAIVRRGSPDTENWAASVLLPLHEAKQEINARRARSEEKKEEPVEVPVVPAVPAMPAVPVAVPAVPVAVDDTPVPAPAAVPARPTNGIH